MKNRVLRINDEIKEQTAIIIRELKDPRLDNSFITVVKADTSSDLKFCKIYVSILGDDKEKTKALEALKNAEGFVRKSLAASSNLRTTPQINFILDTSLDHSIRISEILKDA